MPLLLTAGGLGVAGYFVAWRPPQALPPAAAPTATRELRQRGLELENARSENAALRFELDRLLGTCRAAVGAARPAETAGSPGPTPSARLSKEELAGLGERYAAALASAVRGDERAADEAYEAVLQLIRSGPDGFPVLRDAYLGATDPRIRAVIVRSFTAGLGPEASDFIASGLRSETDPALRAELVSHASRMVTPNTAPAFRDSFLQALDSDSDPGARTAAVRGLRFVRGDADVDRALIGAAADPVEEVRLAAIENVASRPALRSELETLLARDPSGRVRQIGQCRLLLTEPSASP